MATRGRHRPVRFVLRTALLVGLVMLSACDADGSTDPQLGDESPASEAGTPAPGVDTDAPGTVPWDDRTAYAAWPPAPETRPRADACTADDLEVWRIERDGGGGNLFLFVSLEKVSAGRCTLAGFPRIQGTGAGGNRVDVPVGHDAETPWQHGETPATIERYETAMLTITTGVACAAGSGEAPLPYRSWTDVDLVLPDATRLPLSRDLKTVCNPRVTRFYRQAGYPTEPPSRWPGIQAKLVLPDSVRRGQTVDYVVELRNITEDPVDLQPCGGYRQEVQVVGAGMGAEPIDGGRTDFRLNCDADPTLAPGEARRFAMRLELPDWLPGNEVLFSWGFVDNMPDYSAQQWVPLADS